MDGTTVVALSTPPGESAIAVVRMSGTGAVDILDRMAGASGPWESHKVYRKILKKADGGPIDEVLVTVMSAPDSYTGEDVVEISCHGSVHIYSSIIEEALYLGAHPAGPGEFTKRAYLKGKIDLTQAEAIADLISAETQLQARVALEQLEGSLSKKIGKIEKRLLEELALLELSIDFSEEDIELCSRDTLRKRSEEITEELKQMIDSEITGKKLRNGIRVTVLGPRNAGKSSIYNALLGEERAIVSAVPGTTRDLLRERIHIGGFTYYLEDTAGIGQTECEIETKGISIGRKAAEGADLILFVIDGSAGWDDESRKEFEKIAGKNHILVLNKKDLGADISCEKYRPKTLSGSAAEVSAKTGEGIQSLRKMIYKKTVRDDAAEIVKERGAVSSRHAAALREAVDAVKGVIAELEGAGAVEIMSLEIREAIEALGKVTGRSVAGELLDLIFSRFCIGK
ncbi:MAG: tRNA uridine-5-carboxymethylaminomethyl(34) synthesis GTPase MnmE [Candidatus Krumholzibacteriota bacterium]|nr:tRNA uridine-5-carboxymethylaminomethyl(34) synthesis GTPase MnmE [Candidatus Krumholzibacteriota bacterium]